MRVVAHAGAVLPPITAAERAVADALPIDVPEHAARDALARVPLWFHTFALNRAAGIYTQGVARDHRYRLPAFPSSFAGLSVLDVGTFDGFYAFLAEARGAASGAGRRQRAVRRLGSGPVGMRADRRRGLSHDR